MRNQKNKVEDILGSRQILKTNWLENTRNLVIFLESQRYKDSHLTLIKNQSSQVCKTNIKDLEFDFENVIYNQLIKY